MSFNLPNYRKIEEFIKKNAQRKVKIVAITKYHPVESVQEAINSGVRIFGENRVQEAKNKYLKLKDTFGGIELHLTGPLQTNKVKNALQIFDVFQTLDREKLAIEFHKHKESLQEKNFFVQINTGKEDSKSGVYPESADEFIKYCVNDLNLPVVGLMCIPPSQENPTPHFSLLRKFAEKNNLKQLSIGMSGDYKEAILAGATHIRVGTVLFGSRNEK
jgi:pyridoxal phosphate enzyme (YggS family)